MKKLPIVLVLSGVLISAGITSCSKESNNDVNEVKEFNVNFIVDDTIYHTIKTSGNEILTLPSNPIKAGYTFKGWYLSKEYKEEFLSSSLENKALESDLNVYAKFNELIEWTPIKKVINFYVDDSIYHQILTNGNEELELPKEPTKDGYQFDAWYKDETFESTFDITYYKNHELTDSINVYAKFFKESEMTPIKKTITFYVDNSFYHQILTNGKEDLSLPKDPVRPGSKFDGWYLDTNFNKSFNIEYYKYRELEDSIEVYAKFIIETFKVNFVTNGGSEVNSINTNVISKAPVTTKDGYTFEGWYFDEEFKNKVTFPLDVTHDLTLYASWKEIKPQVKPFEINEKGVITKFNDTTSKIVTIPNNIDGIDVLEIGSNLFSNNKVIEEVTLPNTLKYIGYSAFNNATNLKKVLINSDIKTIPASTFENCINLNSINLPDSIEYINANSFANTGITSFTAPKNLINIGNEAFKDAKKLASLNLGTVKKIYRAAFEGCEALKEVVLPDSLKDLNEDYVFLNATNLTKVTMPKKLISVSSTLFKGTKLYLDTSNWKDNILYIDNYLIKVNEKDTKTKIVLDKNTKVIAGGGFNDLTQEVVINEGLEVISDKAFYNKNKINKVNIPLSVNKIGHYAFTGTEIYKNPSNIYNDAIYLDKWMIGVNYSISNENNIKNFVIKEGTRGISDGEHLSYSSRSLLETLTLNKELLYIGDNAFINTKITNIDFPDTLIKIGSKAFYGTNLKEVTLKNETSIEEDSFNKDVVIYRK